MSQSNRRVLSRGRHSRLIRGLILVFVVALLVSGVFFVLSQTTNKLTLVNDWSEPMMVGHVMVGTDVECRGHFSDEWQSHTLLLRDHMMPPHTRLTLTYSGRPNGPVIVAVEKENSKHNRKNNFETHATWGCRWTLVWDAENEEDWDTDASTLRRLYDSIEPLLPLPASWRE